MLQNYYILRPNRAHADDYIDCADYAVDNWKKWNILDTNTDYKYALNP